MAKIDKSKYTKAEWKVVREARRKQKSIERAQKAEKKLKESKDTERTVNIAVNNNPPTNKAKNYIVCLKHGSKYGAEYVNNLYNMTRRHCTVPHEFVCFTDDIRDINPHVHMIPLKPGNGLSGWWYKPLFFDKDLPITGNILYFDLDIVIHDNIDKLFTYNEGKFLICRDFNRSIRHDWNRMNSSVFRLHTGSLPFVYDNFIKEAPLHIRKFHGDQDWIFDQLKDKKNIWQFWPDHWIQSYKWEMRDRNDLERAHGRRNFKRKAEPKIPNECSVAVFHGEPHPHQVEDDWVKENWR
tara:strand:+ start:1734 stop:2621 length:888 start_codon:yes stop_codon:yes gene_type:complete